MQHRPAAPPRQASRRHTAPSRRTAHLSASRLATRRRWRRLRLGTLIAVPLAVILLAALTRPDAGTAAAPAGSDGASSSGTSFVDAATTASSHQKKMQQRRRHRAAKRRAAAAAAAKRAAGTATAAKPSAPAAAPGSSTGTSTAPSTAPSSPSGAASGPGAAATAPTTGGPFVPYTADSLFRKPLPDAAPVAANSAQMVAWAAAHEPESYLKIRGANGVGWGIAYAEASCSDPIYRIGAGGSVPASQAHLRTVGFHAPAAAWKNIPQNGDAPFLIVDRCGTSARPNGLSVWGANAVVSGQTVNVSAAGSFAHDTNGLDRRNPASNSQLNERSRGVIPDSMLIRPDVLDYAVHHGTGLGYMLEVFWLETNSAAGFTSPMVGAEGGNNGVGAEGQRIRIKPGIDLAARPGCSPTTNPVGLAIARTLQQNGAYIGDNSGSGSGIKTAQNAQYPGLNADSLRGCMTWDDVEFLAP
jgi:hypothetical protein